MKVLVFLLVLHAFAREINCFTFGSKRQHSRKQSLHGINIGDLQIPLSICVGLCSLIPTSILVDGLFQKGLSRISRIANYRITDEIGSTFVHISRPVGTSPGGRKRPVVILIHQFFGLRERDTELCDELAKLGYLAIAPDCFQGNTTSIIPRAISFVANAAYKDDWILPLRDMRRVISFLERECGEWADMDNIIVSGFCFGGGLALRYADTYADNVKACAVFYGKPLNEFSRFSCDFYGVYGDRDRQFPPTMVNQFESELTTFISKQGSTKSIEIRRYADKAHAFVEDLECIKKGGDASDAWTGFLSLINRVTNRPSEEKEWGQSFIGQDVCGSKLNNDPFSEIDGKPDSWEDMMKRIDAISKRRRLEETFFSNMDKDISSSSAVEITQ